MARGSSYGPERRAVPVVFPAKRPAGRKSLIVGSLLAAVVLGALLAHLVNSGTPTTLPGGTAWPIPPNLGGSQQAYNLWARSTGPLPIPTAVPTTLPTGGRGSGKGTPTYSVLGPPTVRAAFLDEVLSSYGSPTAGMGQSLYNLGVQYGIDPVYALAFFMHESLFGTTGEARATLSLGNERCIPDRPCIDQNRGGYAQMQSWQDGFEHWYKLIRNLYVAQWGLITVDQIIPRYAPNSDGNNEQEYIAALKHEVGQWRAGVVRV